MAKPGEHKTVNCVQCGHLYRQARSDQLFCGGKCSSAAWRGRRATLLKCHVCQSVFRRTHSNQKYCDDGCAQAADRSRLQKKNTGSGKGWSSGLQKVPRRSCQLCGGRFYAPPTLVRRGGGKFCSNDCRFKFMATHPELFPQTQNRRGRGGKREDLGGVYFRSSWEANWARYLNWLISQDAIKSWSYETETYEFHSIKRGTRFYTPDFIVVENNDSITRYEIKGYMDARSTTKLNRMKKYYPGVKIILIDKHAYRSIANKIASIIPGWESVRGKAAMSD